MKFVPKDWREFQHYKDRAPPWIRLHRKLLDNKDFHRLPVESRALAPMLWLLASESVDGVIEATVDDLAFRLRSTEEAIMLALRPLFEKGFFRVVQPDSTPLAPCLQPATPEAETEASQSTEAEAKAKAETSFAGPAAHAPSKPKRPPAPRRETPKSDAPSSVAWASYADAYRRRYGVDPVRNQLANSQLAQFVGRVGAEEAPAIAAFYVGHQGRYYVQQMHPVGSLLRDAEKLRTEWATGRQTTAHQATQADRTQTNLNAFAPLLQRAEEEERQHARE